MVKEKTIKVSKKFHKKLMKMKYNLGYDDVEDLIKSLIEIAEKFSTANQLKKEDKK